jgi:uncharacterized paraquat-inducible protein A
MDDTHIPREILPRLNDEWTAERFVRSMLLPFGVIGRTPDELQTCPHCARMYYRSNAGACPRCGGLVPVESPRTVTLPFGLT